MQQMLFKIQIFEDSAKMDAFHPSTPRNQAPKCNGRLGEAWIHKSNCRVWIFEELGTPQLRKG
jgi:hypothetical protein